LAQPAIVRSSVLARAADAMEEPVLVLALPLSSLRSLYRRMIELLVEARKEVDPHAIIRAAEDL
jgi:hypothetical protein